MNEPKDTLPDDIQAMLHAERASLHAPSDGQARLAERLAAVVPGFGAPAIVTHATAMVAHAPATLPAKAVAAPWLAKMLLAVAVSGSAAVIVASGVHASRSTRVTAPVTVRVPMTRLAELPPPASTIETPAFDEPPPPVAPPTRHVMIAPRASSGSPPSPITTLAEERRLLDDARTAMNRGDARTALALTAEHAARAPHGMLTEERYALRISALVRLGQRDEARALLQTMRAEYPESFLLPRATNDVESIP